MIVNTIDLFNEDPVDARALYCHYFNDLPSEFYISGIDGEKAFTAFSEKYAARIARVFKYEWYDKEKKKVCFWRALAVLDNQCVAEFDQSVCELWHNDREAAFLIEAANLIAPFKQRQRREALEINVVIRGNNRLELKAMEIKRTRLDLGLYYNPGFREIDTVIRQRLNKSKDKGIVLLHGIPGTGKTTYLRYLISRIKKRILFVSPAVTNDLMNPDFIQLLTSNPDTVLIIEDAENVIMDRRHNPGSSVSNLLNISDGLLSDFLSVQLICTFNSPLTLVDSALLRKGRLIAKYEFGKLDVAQSQRLSNHLGFDTIITSPMTVAEIAGQHERQVEPERMEILGFRSHLATN
ncbi:MAG TPA: AAA family ATPase, partial [Puia sp.]|nr:AAA family ATPase [Puia sp.]